jgi:hypothetical protein
MFTCALLSLGAGIANGQSGRRIPERRTPAPAPAPETAASPAQSEPARPKVDVLLTRHLGTINIPDSVADAVISACSKELSKSRAIAVRSAKDMRRDEAIDLAKSEKSAYVLWIWLDPEALDGDNGGIGPVPGQQMVAVFALYSPGTADVKTQGRIHFSFRYGLQRAAGVPIPTSPKPAHIQYYPSEAGEEIARRVAAALADETPRSAPPIW